MAKTAAQRMAAMRERQRNTREGRATLIAELKEAGFELEMIAFHDVQAGAIGHTFRMPQEVTPEAQAILSQIMATEGLDSQEVFERVARLMMVDMCQELGIDFPEHFKRL